MYVTVSDQATNLHEKSATVCSKVIQVSSFLEYRFQGIISTIPATSTLRPRITATAMERNKHESYTKDAVSTLGHDSQVCRRSPFEGNFRSANWSWHFDAWPVHAVSRATGRTLHMRFNTKVVKYRQPTKRQAWLAEDGTEMLSCIGVYKVAEGN